MRRFDDKTSWEGARGDLLFTAAALEASARHEKLHKVVQQQLSRWMTIEGARREVEDGVTRAGARVSWCDYGLDSAVRWLANELLRDAGGNRDEKTFRKVFPEPPNEVIRLGLESEVDRCATMVTVAGKVKLSKSAAAKLADLEAALAAGRKALEGRREAYTAQTGVWLDIAAWKQAADAVRQSVHVQLQAWALEHGEEREYADRFFPVTSTRPSKAKVPVSPEKQPSGGGNPK